MSLFSGLDLTCHPVQELCYFQSGHTPSVVPPLLPVVLFSLLLSGSQVRFLVIVEIFLQQFCASVHHEL